MSRELSRFLKLLQCIRFHTSCVIKNCIKCWYCFIIIINLLGRGNVKESLRNEELNLGDVVVRDL